jgi:hypothetical protein
MKIERKCAMQPVFCQKAQKPDRERRDGLWESTGQALPDRSGTAARAVDKMADRHEHPPHDPKSFPP